ncbi:MAG TPA: DUF1622 domain-containing protein [Nostoc sp.]|uniref:DUF1622 domain-containing protein n=1 Tax=Nostoc sp. TaxID=1180 RepID=UPI002D6CE8EC|nr:DUF1622 domain-containing protein [Nostoc sp.]HYX17366.1 DUF1622 domain-containing protein [Nostoc sp.]
MEAFVTNLTTVLATVVDIFTGIIIAIAVLEAVVKILVFFFSRRKKLNQAKEEIRLELGMWLALCLEFALAADILRSTIAPTWDEIGKLAAIIGLRTILNFFLAKEIEQARNKKNNIKDESF